MGRWSRLLADSFLRWLGPRPGVHWLEVGCGTGALTGRILAMAGPGSVTACEPAAGLLARARATITDPRVTFAAGSATALPGRDGGYGTIVSGLVLNFVPDPGAGLRAMRQAAAPDGVVAAYVWDYAEGMEFLRHFWDAAGALDLASVPLDEARRFPICRPEPLRGLWQEAGFRSIREGTLECETSFAGFADFWDPFEGGQGPAPTYLMGLDPERRNKLRTEVQARLRPAPDGSIRLRARAWAISGLAPP